MDDIVSFHTLEFTVECRVEGSVRVDLLGGTLDLNPINLILPNVVTLNVATSLKAKAHIVEIDFDGVEIVSLDYNTTTKYKRADFNLENLQNNFFGNLTFIAYLLDLFKIHSGIRLELESGSPPGAGLGGSSAMGVTCFKAFSEYQKKSLDRIEAISKVNSIEARILDSGPAGYQDYYPALFGGILGLVPEPGKVIVDQLYSDELKNYLESHLTLVYSGETRLSGINNWEVYKAFFNKDKEVRSGLSNIAKLSNEAYQNIKKKSFEGLNTLIGHEGEERRKLFPGILTPNMNLLREDLVRENKNFGLKVCGAGGGGCFLITHGLNDKEFVDRTLLKYQMKKLDFKVEKPL
jgi:D-glycero-alpha-D-manno-heptose-7-phosphate kinase